MFNKTLMRRWAEAGLPHARGVAARPPVGALQKTIGVEVASLNEGMLWSEAGADVIQSEKFTPEMIADLVSRPSAATRHPIVAAADGIRAQNVAAYVATGAKFIVTSRPFTAKLAGVSVRMGAIGSGKSLVTVVGAARRPRLALPRTTRA